MQSLRNDAAADPAELTAQLPADPPAEWQRADSGGGIVEYRLPGDDGVCAAGKVTVRPDLLGERAVRVDRKQGCHHAGTTYYDDVKSAADAVTMMLDTALADE